MIKLNKFFIEKYINKLTKQDIINYINNQKINLEKKEIDIIYYYIKNKYKSFLNGHQKEILEELKQKVTPTTYKIIENYYNQYQNKI